VVVLPITNQETRSMRTSRLWLPAALLTLAVTAAGAQDTTVSKGDVARAPSFEGLVAAITRTPATVDELLKRQAIGEEDVIPVDTKPLLTGQGDEMLKIQLDRHKTGIKDLQDLLGKHPGVAARLKKESANPSVGEVIAAEVMADNKIRLYYRKE
jgi:hypothetical protein